MSLQIKGFFLLEREPFKVQDLWTSVNNEVLLTNCKEYCPGKAKSKTRLLLKSLKTLKVII